MIQWFLFFYMSRPVDAQGRGSTGPYGIILLTLQQILKKF